MNNLGELKYFLGIEVARSKNGMFLSQHKYVLDLLTEVRLLECKPMDTLIVQNHRLGEYSDGHSLRTLILFLVMTLDIGEFELRHPYGLHSDYA